MKYRLVNFCYGLFEFCRRLVNFMKVWCKYNYNVSGARVPESQRIPLLYNYFAKLPLVCQLITLLFIIYISSVAIVIEFTKFTSPFTPTSPLLPQLYHFTSIYT